jgi:hypothetical protein
MYITLETSFECNKRRKLYIKQSDKYKSKLVTNLLYRGDIIL